MLLGGYGIVLGTVSQIFPFFLLYEISADGWSIMGPVPDTLTFPFSNTCPYHAFQRIISLPPQRRSAGPTTKARQSAQTLPMMNCGCGSPGRGTLGFGQTVRLCFGQSAF